MSADIAAPQDADARAHAALVERVADARARRGFGSRELCVVAGLSTGVVADLENRRTRDLMLDTLRRLAGALDVSLVWLVGGAPDPRANPAAGAATHTALVRRITLARARRGLGSRELCLAAGLTTSAVSSLENGHSRDVTLRTLRRLAAALGVPLAWLVAGVGEMGARGRVAQDDVGEDPTVTDDAIVSA